jgi:chemotaxis protein methyltransferase CheR
MDKITRERGFQCSSYKDKCLRRRIAVRMRAMKALGYDEYASILDADPREYEKLIRALTINVTKFFRNWETYEAMEQRVIPELFERSERDLRIWSAGCSTGEEPYSVAILMHKHAARMNLRARLETTSILATDIDAHCLGEAERAFYGEAALGETPATLRERYFPEVAGLWTVLPEVKKLVTFARCDVLQTPAAEGEYHLIVCRNVVIYFEREAQEKLFHDLHRALAPGGFLVLGKVETLLGDVRSLFTPVNARERIFRKA